jgi:hypothetical protein
VAKARKNAEVSGAFIREHVMALLLGAKDMARQIDRETQQRLQEEDDRLKLGQCVRDIFRFLRLIAAIGTKLDRLAQEWPDPLLLLTESGELQEGATERQAHH